MSDPAASKSPPLSPRPKIPLVPPPQRQVGGGAKQALMIALAVVILAIGVHQGLLMFTGGASPHKDEVMQTFAMIKPDCAHNKAEILERIKSNGYRVVRQADMTLSVEKAKELYDEHSNTQFFDDLVSFMTSGPVTALLLEKTNAIKDWRALIGPTDAAWAKEVCPETCLRAQFGTDAQNNCLHGSDSRAKAERETQLIFGGVAAETIETDKN